MNNKPGVVYWITGLSGAGKTTIGRLLYNYLCERKKNVIFLDNDAMKDVLWSDEISYSREERKKRALVGGRLAKYLADQGMEVICCSISMFDDVRKWNRDNMAIYKEIFLDVSMDVLVKRDSKGLYKNKEKDIVGADIAAEFPKNPDMIIHNNGTETPENITKEIVDFLGL